MHGSNPNSSRHRLSWAQALYCVAPVVAGAASVWCLMVGVSSGGQWLFLTSTIEVCEAKAQLYLVA